MTRYRVTAKVVRILEGGTCPQGFEPGMEFELSDDERMPCRSAKHALQPACWVLQFGGEFPWQRDPDVIDVCCPDSANPVVFEVRRTPVEQ